jgi:hypothetical protein
MRHVGKAQEARIPGVYERRAAPLAWPELFQTISGISAIRGGRCSGAQLGTGLDVRANGGYIVAPPSRHAAGAYYRWLDSFTDDHIPTEIPAWIAKVLPSGTSPARAPSSTRDKIPQGGRNDHLVRLAGKLRGENASDWEIELKLLEENQIRCDPPIPDNEVRNIARSIARYPAGRPKKFLFEWREALMSDSGPEDSTTNHILLVLSTYMDTDGRSCFPSIETVAANSKRHPDTVKKILRKAAKQGWIGKFPRFVGGEQTSNGYVAKIPPGVITGTPGGDL